jgi:hypothetical protein
MNTASFFIRKKINNKAKTSLKLEPFPIDILQKNALERNGKYNLN